MVCILYVIAIGTLLGMVGVLSSAPCPDHHIAQVDLVRGNRDQHDHSGHLPNANHRSSVTEVLENQVVPSHLGHAVGTASLNALNQGWAARIESLNPLIERIWLISAGIIVLWGVATAARVYFVVARSRKQNGERTPAVVDGVPIVVTDSIGPATVGIMRSRVVVPHWVLALPGCSGDTCCGTRKSIELHETRCFFSSPRSRCSLMPWNLALWWQLRRLRLAVEMDCDNRVVSALGDANAYGELLFKVAQAASRGPRLQPAFLGAGMLERRLTALVAPTPLRHVQRFLLPAVAAGLLFLVLSMPHPVLETKSTAPVTYSATARRRTTLSAPAR